MGKKYKILGGGGLGDAAILFAKIKNLSIPIEDIELTHVEIPEILLPAIKEFYDTQKINTIVKKIPNWSWKNEHRKDFDLVLDTSAYGIEEDGIIIKPFPNINVDSNIISSFNCLISPESGRKSERSFNYNDITIFLSKKNHIFALIGKISEPEKYDKLGVVNLINSTSMIETLSLISQSSIVIAPSGFISIISCMMGKIVYTKDGRKEIENRYYHKDWNNCFITNLTEIKIK